MLILGISDFRWNWSIGGELQKKKRMWGGGAATTSWWVGSRTAEFRPTLRTRRAFYRAGTEDAWRAPALFWEWNHNVWFYVLAAKFRAVLKRRWLSWCWTHQNSCGAGLGRGLIFGVFFYVSSRKVGLKRLFLFRKRAWRQSRTQKKILGCIPTACYR